MDVGGTIPQLTDIGVEPFMNFIVGVCNGCSATDPGAVRALQDTLYSHRNSFKQHGADTGSASGTCLPGERLFCLFS